MNVTRQRVIERLRVLEARLETAKALIRFYCGQGSYSATIDTARNALYAVYTALESDAHTNDRFVWLTMVREAYQDALAVVQNLESLVDAMLCSRLSPSLN